ncbi:MAG: ABC transporter permease [Pseudonocardia sp.]|nr:ABC transporter permease [Pseudonocardia sp.]
MTTLTAADPAAVPAPPAGGRSVRGRVLRRLLHNPSAVFGIVVVLIVVLLALLAPWLAPYDPNEQDLLSRLQPPSPQHLLGADDFGRDQLSRLIYGARVTLAAALLAVSIGFVLGVASGMLAGFAGGRLDSLLSRVVEILMALPGFLLAVTVIAVLGPGLTNAMLAVGVLLTPPFFRVARASTQTVREETYIEASRALGCTTWRILTRHVLPNMIAPILVQLAILFGLAITFEASLSFIGLGVQPPTSTWGSMLTNASSYMAEAPHMVYVPGILIALTVLSFSLVGDGLAKALGTNRPSGPGTR